MVGPHDIVVPLKNLDRDDAAYVGAKSANLGELIQAKFPVPAGFAVTSYAQTEFLRQGGLDKKIESLLSTINYDSPDSIDQVSKSIVRLITTSKMPDNIVHAVFDEYHKLGVHALVAIRLSTVGWGGAEFEHDSFLDVRGDAWVSDKIREVWAKIYTPKSIVTSYAQGFSLVNIKVAVTVEKMVESEFSGVIKTQALDDKNKASITAIIGLGEYLKTNKIEPDTYEVNKKTLQIISKQINTQIVQLTKVGSSDKEKKIPSRKGASQKLKDFEIIALTKLGVRIEKHYYFPQVIEWAKEGDKIFIVETRPLEINNNEPVFAKAPILTGQPLAPGIVTGHVKKINGSQMPQVGREDILITEKFDNESLIHMKKAGAVIVEQDAGSHSSFASKELGTPVVIGAGGALSRLKSGEIITVNGKTGEIVKGGYTAHENMKKDRYSDIKTATKLFVTLSEAAVAQQIASQNIDGVGLLKAETIIRKIGMHPKKAIHDGRGNEFSNLLASEIGVVCKAFFPRPVIFRTSDFTTQEYGTLSGGKFYEPGESNPVLGYRGAFRYLHDPKSFRLELAAIKKVREKMGFNNLQIMLPFIRNVKELEETKKLLTAEGLKRSHTFKVHIVAEVPSFVVMLEDFINAGVDGVIIDVDDLTMLILGADRDNSEIAPEFDERSPAVLWALERIIKMSRKYNINTSLYGRAALFPSIVEDLIRWGVDSISVDTASIEDARRILYMAEGRVINRKIK